MTKATEQKLCWLTLLFRVNDHNCKKNLVFPVCSGISSCGISSKVCGLYSKVMTKKLQYKIYKYKCEINKNGSVGHMVVESRILYFLRYS